ncbi:hypothetical protein LXA43DRAFT_840938, partial [Ganoderma leucocontextum]
VYIKFVSSYGEEVHKVLSEAGFAPALRWCGRVCGGSIMVVMDEIVDGRTIEDFLERKETVTMADLKHLDDALKLLSAKGLVHGDLRPPNVVLQRCKNSGANMAYLIDFDWAGKEGEVRYPSYLNPDVQW